MSEKKEPLLLLDNSTMYVIGAGDYHSTNLSFEEAKAIIDMYDAGDILRCFTDRATEQVLHDFVGIEPRDFAYKPIRKMRVGQDAIAVKLHITPGDPARGGGHRRRHRQKDPEHLRVLPVHHPQRVTRAKKRGGAISTSLLCVLSCQGWSTARSMPPVSVPSTTCSTKAWASSGVKSDWVSPAWASTWMTLSLLWGWNSASYFV